MPARHKTVCRNSLPSDFRGFRMRRGCRPKAARNPPTRFGRRPDSVPSLLRGVHPGRTGKSSARRQKGCPQQKARGGAGGALRICRTASGKERQAIREQAQGRIFPAEKGNIPTVCALPETPVRAAGGIAQCRYESQKARIAPPCPQFTLSLLFKQVLCSFLLFYLATYGKHSLSAVQRKQERPSRYALGNGRARLRPFSRVSNKISELLQLRSRGAAGLLKADTPTWEKLKTKLFSNSIFGIGKNARRKAQ